MDDLENLIQMNENTGHYNIKPGTLENKKYDFIIVGSGSAGSVIANRLSEIPNWNILLLETGEEATPLTDIPGLAPFFLFTQYNWGYLMEKQDNFCLGLTDQRMHWPRGRALGGTTIINYMIHVRGNKHDYDRWASFGNPGWSYEDVLPYFLKSEDASVRINDPPYRHKGGYLSVGDVPFRSQSVHVFVRAAQELGYKYVDYNGKEQLGVSYVQATIRRGLRCSAEKAFLMPVRNRTNLTILTKARVTKVLIDPQTKEAYGVEYVRNKKRHIVNASKEVILSAGAFNSPQLLMLSGIGPEDHLRELGIPILKALPVGQKMYDHLTFLGLVFTVNESIVVQQEEVLKDSNNYLQLIKKGAGAFTTIGGVEALAYLKTNVANYTENYPDMEFMFIGGGLQTDKGVAYSRMFRIDETIYNRIWKPLENAYAWSVLPMLLHPKSYGYLKLKSKNPFHWPLFYGNFFTDPNNEDVKTFIAAIREVQRISKTPAFQRYNSQQVKTPIPGCENQIFDSDEYWECALRYISATLHHQVSTCKMGPSDDPEAVVDNKLRVYGIRNLRVADTSIIPLTLSAHTNVPTYMVGEKASDLIKEEWMQYNTNNFLYK
ncbi:hypothetical protein ILUMI_02912 [Ignelater luminosus]|uniref:Glucose-methanol-choline oxidoreductase N-terminal domain-containing protein n=1 Tax=Ignelater luminosus TaxID=2038154 RepID=A0A8K0DHB8_IGNLU|nr:hypothetical protein ILUMI_02912 [Ignelater luminosus]